MPLKVILLLSHSATGLIKPGQKSRSRGVQLSGAVEATLITRKGCREKFPDSWSGIFPNHSGPFCGWRADLRSLIIRQQPAGTRQPERVGGISACAGIVSRVGVGGLGR